MKGEPKVILAIPWLKMGGPRPTQPILGRFFNQSSQNFAYTFGVPKERAAYRMGPESKNIFPSFTPKTIF